MTADPVIGLIAAYTPARLEFRGTNIVLGIIITTSMFPGISLVILPLAAQGVFTTAIVTFIAAWNDLMIALAMITRKDVQTANMIISQFTGQTGRDQPFGSIMAAGVIVTTPLVIAVLIFQRRIVAGLTAGGVK